MSETLKLSICIPTYNRLDKLRGCLELLIPQLAVLPPSLVDIIIVNNASTDGTEQFLNSLPGKYPFVNVFHNSVNLGFDGNTIKCIEHADGDYAALLSDDDRYIDGQVARILEVISKGDYALLCLNHYSFWTDVHRPYQTCAPEEDVVFTRALDILHFPAFGHFSGIIYNSRLAKERLDEIMAKRPLVTRDRSRGIYMEVALRVMSASSLPAYFIGARRLAVTIPHSVDYSLLSDLILGSLHNTLILLEDGVITTNDWDRGIAKGISQMPLYIIRDLPKMSGAERREVTAELVTHFGANKRFRFTCLPLLCAGRFRLVRFIYKWAYRLAKPLVTAWKNVRTFAYARRMAKIARSARQGC